MKNLFQHINQGNIKFIFSLLLILISFFLFIFNNKSKIDITNIIKKHIKTLKNIGDSKISKQDMYIFFIFPIFMALFLKININLDDGKLSILVTIFTIFIGLLFNILAILLAFDIEKATDVHKEIHKEFRRQILYNISFEIIISIFVLIISMIKFIELNFYLNFLTEFLLYYLFVLFILTLFMVLKRFILLSSKIN